MTAWYEFHADPRLQGRQRVVVQVQERHLAVLLAQHEEYLKFRRVTVSLHIPRDLVISCHAGTDLNTTTRDLHREADTHLAYHRYLRVNRTVFVLGIMLIAARNIHYESSWCFRPDKKETDQDTSVAYLRTIHCRYERIALSLFLPVFEFSGLESSGNRRH